MRRSPFIDVKFISPSQKPAYMGKKHIPLIVEDNRTTAVAVADIQQPNEGDLPEPGDEPVELPVQVTTPAPPSLDETPSSMRAMPKL